MSRWPKRIAIGYICVIIMLVAGHFANIYPPQTGIADEYFGQYLWVSGPFVFILGELTASYFRGLVYLIFKYEFTSATAVIIIIPGIFHILFGSIQWYFLTKWSMTVWKFLQKIDQDEREKEKRDG